MKKNLATDVSYILAAMQTILQYSSISFLCIIEIFSYLSYFSFHIKKITRIRKKGKIFYYYFSLFFFFCILCFLHKVHFQFDFMLFSFRFIYLLQFPHTGKLCSISLSNTIPISSFFIL